MSYKSSTFPLVGLIFLMIGLLGVTICSAAAKAPDNKTIGINVLLNTDISEEVLADLSTYGKVTDVIPEINAVFMQARARDLSAIQALPYVKAANPDAVRQGRQIDTVPVEDFGDGLSTWNLDAIKVTNFNNRVVDFNGEGVYVAVLDTGLVHTWRRYFPQERIATEYAKSFGGGGRHVAEQPNKWEHDTDSHGTSVTSAILGYSLGGTPAILDYSLGGTPAILGYSLDGTPVNGVAPMAWVIPVKVLNNNGDGKSSVVIKGIVYVADLKNGPLAGSPVVINISFGGPRLDAVEQAAIDYAIGKGVIVVAAAGNEGIEGMSYPGAYEPVISAGASGFVGEWSNQSWWWNLDVPDPPPPPEEFFYVDPLSSRELEGQDLDVLAPGTWVVAPYQLQMGKTSYDFFSGTSISSPQVAGIVALMAQKYPALTPTQAESILETTAIFLPPGEVTVMTPYGVTEDISWDADATGAGLVDAAAALAATP
jgi:subtilisin family serine protease